MTALAKKTRDLLKEYVKKIETINDAKAELSDDAKAIFASAKAAGFDLKTIRRVIRLRKMDATERAEAESLLNTYLVALGMQPDLFDTGEATVDGTVDGTVVPLKTPELEPAE